MLGQGVILCVGLGGVGSGRIAVAEVEVDDLGADGEAAGMEDEFGADGTAGGPGGPVRDDREGSLSGAPSCRVDAGRMGGSSEVGRSGKLSCAGS